MCLIDQHVAISRFPSTHVYYRLVRVLHRSLLNPRLDTFLRRQLQHLLYLMRRTDGAAADLATLCDQREGVERRHFVFGGADLDERAVCAEQRQILLEWHVGRGDCADDEI